VNSERALLLGRDRELERKLIASGPIHGSQPPQRSNPRKASTGAAIPTGFAGRVSYSGMSGARLRGRSTQKNRPAGTGRSRHAVVSGPKVGDIPLETPAQNSCRGFLQGRRIRNAWEATTDEKKSTLGLVACKPIVNLDEDDRRQAISQ